MKLSKRRAFRDRNMGKGSTVGIYLVLSRIGKAHVAGTHDGKGQEGVKRQWWGHIGAF